MFEYEDGTRVEINKQKLIISVYDAPDAGNFDISGFESLFDIDLFLNFGDFTEGKDNDFHRIAGKKTLLTWIPKN